MTRAQKHRIKDGMVLLHRRSKEIRGTLVFLTTTIPTQYRDGESITEDDHRRLLVNWTEARRQFCQELQRLLERKGLPVNYVFAVEPQEERWLKYRVFAPHIHLVFINQWDYRKQDPRKDKGFGRSGYWAVTLEETDEIWERVLSNVLGKRVNGDSACESKSVRSMRNLAFYLSKLNRVARYMSKGSKYIADICAAGYADCLPHAWAGSDAQTRAEVNASVVSWDVGTGNLGQVKARLQELSSQFEQSHGRPLFSTPHLVTVDKDEGSLAVALCLYVMRLDDIPIALGSLIEMSLSNDLQGELSEKDCSDFCRIGMS